MTRADKTPAIEARLASAQPREDGDLTWLPAWRIRQLIASRIHSWTRVWHPVMPALAERVPYVVVVVELPHAGNIRLIGNLLGDPAKPIEIGARVEGLFEHHGAGEGDPPAQPFTLLQWKRLA